jgi:hypothetical protein
VPAALKQVRSFRLTENATTDTTIINTPVLKLLAKKLKRCSKLLDIVDVGSSLFRGLDP